MPLHLTFFHLTKTNRSLLVLIDGQRLIHLLVPRQTVTTNFLHEGIGIELLDVEDALAFPRAGEDHLRA